MKHFTLSLTEELCLLKQYNLSANELLVIRVLLLLQDDNDDKLFELLYQTLNTTKIDLRNILESLQNKGVILKSFKIPTKGNPLNPYTIPINKNFIKNIYKCSFEMGKELFDVYPQFTYINGSAVPLRGVAKKYNSLEEAYKYYAKAIRYNPELHQTVLDLIGWANNHNIINCSLSTFIVDQKWNDLQALKEGKGESNINYDAVKLL